MQQQYDVKAAQKDNYFIRTYAEQGQPHKIEMSFNLSTYQPHLKVRAMQFASVGCCFGSPSLRASECLCRPMHGSDVSAPVNTFFLKYSMHYQCSGHGCSAHSHSLGTLWMFLSAMCWYGEACCVWIWTMQAAGLDVYQTYYLNAHDKPLWTTEQVDKKKVGTAGLLVLLMACPAACLHRACTLEGTLYVCYARLTRTKAVARPAACQKHSSRYQHIWHSHAYCMAFHQVLMDIANRHALA